MPDFQIWVPSRRRTALMPHLKKLLPGAMVTVDQEEVEEYSKVWDGAYVVPHPKLPGVGAIKRWICLNAPCEYVVIVDDDLQRVQSMTWSPPRSYTDPEVIGQILANGVQICHDLGLLHVTFGQKVNPLHYSNCNPVVLNKHGGVPAIINTRLYRELVKHDPELDHAEDDHFSLQCLLRSRVIVKDTRFNFDFGQIYGHPGGCQGTRTNDSVQASYRALKRKYGAYVQIAETGVIDGAHITVNRKSQLAGKEPS